MRAPDDHERALALVLKPGAHPAEAFEALFAHPEVRAWSFPAPWSFEPFGLDLLAARPALRAIERATLREALDGLLALATPAVLDALADDAWREVPEPVRQFYLKHSFARVAASMVKMAPRSCDLPPDPAFRQGQVFFARFEVEYRLGRRAGGVREVPAPSEEGSLIFYPFDPEDAGARRDLGLPEHGGPVLEAFAWEPERARHARVFQELADARGWQVVAWDGLSGNDQ